MFDVPPDVIPDKGFEVVTDRYPFVELAKRRQRQESPQLRLAEQDGVQYQGLASSTDLVAAGGGQSEESQRKEATLDALDVLGVGPDDPVDLIKDIYRKKSMYYHPDKGGTDEKFKRLKEAYELIMKSRGQTP